MAMEHTRENTFGPRQHAVMFGLLAEAICKHYGPKADALLLEAVETYGEERGRRMAARCRKNGDPLDDMASYFAYCEWSWRGESVRTANDPDCPHVSFRMLKCPGIPPGGKTGWRMSAISIAGVWTGRFFGDSTRHFACACPPACPKSGGRLRLSLGKRGKHACPHGAAKAHSGAPAGHAGQGFSLSYGAPVPHAARLRPQAGPAGGRSRRGGSRAGLCAALWRGSARAGASGRTGRPLRPI